MLHSASQELKAKQQADTVPNDVTDAIYKSLAHMTKGFPSNFHLLERYVLCCNYNNHYSVVCALPTPLQMVLDDVTLPHFYLLHCDSKKGHHIPEYIESLLGPFIARRYYDGLKALKDNPVAKTLTGWVDVRFSFVSVPVPQQKLSSCGPASILFFECLLAADVETVLHWLTTSGKERSANLLDLRGVLGLRDVTEPDYERKRSSLEKRFHQWVRDFRVILD
jgi:hypothetical protein